jgi:hypothetical protein
MKSQLGDFLFVHIPDILNIGQFSVKHHSFLTDNMKEVMLFRQSPFKEGKEYV